MKKLMTMVVGAALVFAVAGQASASTLETKGEFRGRYWSLSNYNRAGGDSVDSTDGFWDQRLRLNMAWQVLEGVKVGARADILEEVWGTTDNEIDFDQAFAQFAIAPATITVGKQDVSWGQGAYAKADNRYRAKVAAKFDPVSVSLAWDANKETRDAEGIDDFNGYTLGVVFPVAGWNLGVLGVYTLDESVADLSNDWMALDITGAGAIGPAKVNFEVAVGSGKMDYDGKDDVDKSGLLAYLGCFAPIGPVNAGLEVGFAQGDEPTADENEGILFFDYNGPFSSVILFNNFDLNGWNSVYADDKGLNNALAFKLSGTMALTEKLSLTGAAVYAMADEAADADDMGIEADLIAKYAVAENVTAQLALAYLAAGDYYGEDVDDPFVASAQFIVGF